MKILDWINEDNEVYLPYTVEEISYRVNSALPMKASEVKKEKYLLPINDKYAYIVKILDKCDTCESTDKEELWVTHILDVCKYEAGGEWGREAKNIRPFKEYAKGQVDNNLRRAILKLFNTIIDLYLKDPDWTKSDSEYAEFENEDGIDIFTSAGAKKIIEELLHIQNLESPASLSEELSYIMLFSRVKFDEVEDLFSLDTFNREFICNDKIIEKQKFVFDFLLSVLKIRG
ncbi:hypothetical protein [Metamycoplasma neophronis]|uniref:Uncharacterized protein n=1 Tax=Metamycoplasma neophronis TaxID=872983 RepID=A0ABY2Z0S0_9BACT|nr:hypothetical protein [Metamycoplasma neophronis]TPR54752.1 hypothetical protein FJR74_00565 [Metamycoplasma neophronis]